MSFLHSPVITQVLSKVQLEKATITLVAPLWMQATWFPLLNQLLIYFPRKLLAAQVLIPPKMTTSYLAKKGPLQKNSKWTLVAWRISGVYSRRQDFLRTVSSLSWTL